MDRPYLVKPMSVNPLPDWVQREEIYSPAQANDGFLTRTVLKVGGLLCTFRAQQQVQRNRSASEVATEFLLVFSFILLTAEAHNAAFLYIVIAIVLVRVALLNGAAIKQILQMAFSAVFMTGFVLLPAVFLGSYHTFTVIILKTFISATTVAVFINQVRWHDFTACLRWFRVSDLFVLTLDLTLKYILMLGSICINVLLALKLRSVGRNRHKHHAMGGVLGVTFLKSRDMSEETYQAMVCRGFTGTYDRPRHFVWTPIDSLHISGMAVLMGVFFYLEGLL